jgi:bifunctional non-homologous end joining protein LigD
VATRKKATGKSSARAKATPRRKATSKSSTRAKATPRKTTAKVSKGANVAKRTKVATRTSPRKPTALAEYRRKRDFEKTGEPEGGAVERNTRTLQFVIQKHAASHLHFDLRLELDGVMKSWAVPKGPSVDPTVRRLAMQVEDHPVEYNTFEGIIPAGEYGGGTVMLWDRGTYTWHERDPDPVARLREGYRKGDLKFVLKGKRLRGSWVLVRIRRGDEDKPQWLLIKHRDEFAEAGVDVVAREMTSVATGRTMEQIASGRSRVWGTKAKARA